MPNFLLNHSTGPTVPNAYHRHRDTGSLVELIRQRGALVGGHV
jgi:hypothetical protein